MEITLKQLPLDLQKLITELLQTNQPLTITDNGEPLAILSPAPQKKRAVFGCMQGTIEIVGDIVAPAVPESEWEVMQ